MQLDPGAMQLPDQAPAPKTEKEASHDFKGDEQAKLDILAEAADDFRSVEDAESINRVYMLDDMRFRAASPDDNYQWPTEVIAARTMDATSARPCLTINKLPGHINQVTNDSRQSKPSIKVHPVDDDADVETAEVYQGMIRHVEYSSDADVAYDTALDNGVCAGVGYVRVLKDYCDETSFDQDLMIRRVRNPLTVFMDPNIQQPDGSDAQFCFVLEKMTEKAFKRQWPDKDPGMYTVPTGLAYWLTEGEVVVAEYWRVEHEEKTLYAWKDGSTSTDRKGPGRAVEQPTHTRRVDTRKVMFYKITAGEILEEIEWDGKYIPIARCVGNEYDVEGRLVVSGMVRTAKDAQRMYNYWASQEVEMLALAPKAPFVGAAGQFDGFETEWQQANVRSMPYLEYNPVVGEDNRAVPAPQRVMPPMPQAAILQAKMGSADDIKATTGQFDASLGAQSNETSGKAIIARQREGDVGTFHYGDNLARCIRFVGRILIDLIPKTYDTKRIARILGEDGSVDHVQLDPDLKGPPGADGAEAQPVASMPIPHPSGDPEMGEIGRIYNLGVGKYDVTVDVGPSYSTKRAEAAESMANFVQAVPAAMPIIGDLMVKNMDWPGADEISKRLRAMVPPQALAAGDLKPGQTAPPAGPQLDDQTKQDIASAHQHMTELTQQVQQLNQQLTQEKLKNADKGADIAAKHMQATIDAQGEKIDAMVKMFDAETRRMAVVNAGAQAAATHALNVSSQATGDALAVAGHQQGVAQADRAHGLATQASAREDMQATMPTDPKPAA